MNETRILIGTFLIGTVFGLLLTASYSSGEITRARIAAHAHVAELEGELARAQEAASRASSRAGDLEERQRAAVAAVERVATNLAGAAARNTRMGELIDAIIVAVDQLEGVYRELGGQP